MMPNDEIPADLMVGARAAPCDPEAAMEAERLDALDAAHKSFVRAAGSFDAAWAAGNLKGVLDANINTVKAGTAIAEALKPHGSK